MAQTKLEFLIWKRFLSETSEHVKCAWLGSVFSLQEDGEDISYFPPVNWTAALRSEHVSQTNSVSVIVGPISSRLRAA